MHKKVAHHLASTLKSAMKERDISISLLNKRTGISRETLYRILRAESLPTTEVLLRLAAELHVSPASFIEVESKERKRGSSTHADHDAVMTLLTSIDHRLARLESL